MRGSRNFPGGGGGGVQVNLTKKTLTFFFLFFFFLSSAYSSDFKENYHFSRFQGGPTFSRGGGGGGGGGGSNCLFPIETHITCDFPGGSGPPVPPLDPHLYNNNLSYLSSIKKTAFTDFKEEFVNRIREKEKKKIKILRKAMILG